MRSPRLSINSKIVLSIFLFALFVGLFTYRLGCNPAVIDKCSSYKMIQGTVYGYSASKKACKKAENMKSCNEPYVLAHYGTHNQTCHFVSGEIINTDGDAATNSKLYHIGRTYSLLQSKSNPKHCYTLLSVTTSWYTSVVCLWLAALFLVLLIRSLIKDVIRRRNSPSGLGEYVSLDNLSDENDKTANISMVKMEQKA